MSDRIHSLEDFLLLLKGVRQADGQLLTLTQGKGAVHGQPHLV
jgi:hypothetical protein